MENINIRSTFVHVYTVVQHGCHHIIEILLKGLFINTHNPINIIVIQVYLIYA